MMQHIVMNVLLELSTIYQGKEAAKVLQQVPLQAQLALCRSNHVSLGNIVHQLVAQNAPFVKQGNLIVYQVVLFAHFVKLDSLHLPLVKRPAANVWEGKLHQQLGPLQTVAVFPL